MGEIRYIDRYIQLKRFTHLRELAIDYWAIGSMVLTSTQTNLNPFCVLMTKVICYLLSFQSNICSGLLLLNIILRERRKREGVFGNGQGRRQRMNVLKR